MAQVAFVRIFPDPNAAEAYITSLIAAGRTITTIDVRTNDRGQIIVTVLCSA